jgi:micrococcal nuclease
MEGQLIEVQDLKGPALSRNRPYSAENVHPKNDRLISVDAPETRALASRSSISARRPAGSWPACSRAGGPAGIQTVPTSRDRYGRLLASGFRESDNLLVNKEIIRQGFGHAYTKYPFDPARMEEFRAAERQARENKRGLWGP